VGRVSPWRWARIRTGLQVRYTWTPYEQQPNQLHYRREPQLKPHKTLQLYRQRSRPGRGSGLLAILAIVIKPSVRFPLVLNRPAGSLVDEYQLVIIIIIIIINILLLLFIIYYYYLLFLFIIIIIIIIINN
jgi:cellulose synthase/poly-beta-1,6-N-acetylglucosamine synthase-like glycosyltransferase